MYIFTSYKMINYTLHLFTYWISKSKNRYRATIKAVNILYNQSLSFPLSLVTMACSNLAFLK